MIMDREVKKYGFIALALTVLFAIIVFIAERHVK
jgi:hypothetical protein